jgi:hypothetical protein
VKSEDWDKLLERGLSGGPPRPGFREEALANSVAAFVQARRSRTWWRAGSLSAAAVLIAGVSFLLGRHSLPAPVAAPVAAKTQGVAVPNDLVAWLDAARLFRQLGMPDRMGRAVDHASRLLPADTALAGGATGPVVAANGGPDGGFAGGPTSDATSRPADQRFTILSALALPATPLPLRPPPLGPRPSSGENVSQIMAQALGD